MSIDTQGEAIRIITHTLQESEGIQIAVGGRVFGGHLKDNEVQGTLEKGPIVIVALGGGLSSYSGALAVTTFSLWGYSARSADEAYRAYQAAYKALQACRVSCPGADLHGLTRETQRPTAGENDKHKAWYAMGRWSMVATGGTA